MKARRSSSAGALPEGSDKQVKTGDQDVEPLRKRCKNTLYVSSVTLSASGLQPLARLITTIVNPLYNAHSEDARVARSPTAVLRYDQENALPKFLEPLVATVSILGDVRTLERSGFVADFDRFRKAITQTHERTLTESDEPAAKSFELVVGLLHYRQPSMGWHVHWPGSLA